MVHESLDKATQGFIDALSADVEAAGKTVKIDTQVAGEASLCTTVINTFTAKNVDLIMANATPVLLAAANATTTIPVLGASVTDYNDTFAGSIVSLVIIAGITIFLLYEFFYTEIGLTLKSTGDNPDMSRAQGVDVNRNKVVGLAIANGIVAMAGALLAQYKGSANINDGRGAIVIGLAAIFIGLSVSTKIKPNFVVSLVGVIGGGIIYYIVYNFVILMGLKTDYLKMLSAIIVALFLGVPYLKATNFTKHKDLHPSDLTAKTSGGECNA